jgi:hypothetical protein
MTTLRFGSYELTSARDANGAARRRFAGWSDCLSLLSRYRLDRAAVRAIVRRSGANVRSDQDALRELARLVFRGAYVVLERPPVRVPLMEMPAEPAPFEEYERETKEDEGDGHPTAIVPREYPLLAAREKQAVETAVALANAELDKQIHRNMPVEPEDKVPEIYRGDAHVTALEIQTLVNTTADALKEHEYTFGADEPSDSLPALYRSGAQETMGAITGIIDTHAVSIGSLTYAGLDHVLAAEKTLNSDATPTAYRGITSEKTQGVKDATNVSANALDALLYQGMPE